MFSVSFLKYAAERALKTFAQALVAILGVGSTGLLNVNWGSALSVSALAALISVLTSIVAATGSVPVTTQVGDTAPTEPASVPALPAAPVAPVPAGVAPIVDVPPAA